MIYPIVAYGNPILKKEAEDLPEGSDLTQLIQDMYATMNHAHGVGLAAPQINQGVRLFVIDSSLMLDEDEEEKGIRRVFINPILLDEYGDNFGFEEGCLSIPGLYGDVKRYDYIEVEAMDRRGRELVFELEGMPARVAQHEIDHLDGVLFTDKVDPATLHWEDPELHQRDED